MPNKKSKSNASKGKAPPASTAPPSTTAPSPQTAAKPPPSTSLAADAPMAEDFQAKNARAKALIMSTLVPGSEPWSIAEPLELASDIWKALEEKYAPKDGGRKSSGKQSQETAAEDENEDKGSNQSHTHNHNRHPHDHIHVSSSDFIGDWVEGKPLDKYLDLYKSDILAKEQSDRETANVKPMPHRPKLADPSPTPDRVLEEMRAVLFPKGGPSESPKPRAPTAPPASESVSVSAPAPAPAPASSSPSSLWIASPVKHPEYLSESQALSFVSNDMEQKKLLQVTATKIMMQKLPTRDLRLLWAVLYGGNDAAWPGSWSPVIPGVTQVVAQRNDFQV